MADRTVFAQTRLGLGNRLLKRGKGLKADPPGSLGVFGAGQKGAAHMPERKRALTP